jgi:hypothetical protein
MLGKVFFRSACHVVVLVVGGGGETSMEGTRPAVSLLVVSFCRKRLFGNYKYIIVVIIFTVNIDLYR